MSSPRSGEWWGPRAARGVWQSQALILPRALPVLTRNKGGLGSSAVCAFPMRSVQRAFGGLYKEVNRETQQWYTDTSPVPEPRPGMVGLGACLSTGCSTAPLLSWSQWLPQHGTQPLPQTLPNPFLSLQCITSHTRHLKINSSLQMPDRVLNFIKDHFLMDSPVRSQPLLLQSQRRYQQIGVHRAPGLHGTYDVLFLGTGGCRRAVRGGLCAPRPGPAQHSPSVCRRRAAAQGCAGEPRRAHH